MPHRSSNHAVHRLAGVAVLLGVALVASSVVPAPAAANTRFSDVRSATHATAIETIAQMAITRGCAPGRYCPHDDVTRAQMASFLAAALSLRDRTPSFRDVSSNNVHRLAIGAIAHAGITRGCGDGTIYCPHDPVTRGQMASFVARAYDLPPGSHSFSDVPQGSTHSASIGAIAAAGITLGFDDGTFRPHDPVRRDQMASFIVRAGGWEGPVPCPDVSGTLSLTDLGPAGPRKTFPITSAIRTSHGLELHSNDQPTTRGARADDAANVTATTTVSGGSRTWATTTYGPHVYVGQWGVTHASGDAAPQSENLFRYSASGSGDRQAEALAAVPTGGEFWSLTADDDGVLYAGTRAHNSGAYRNSIGGLGGDQHVIQTIDPSRPANDRVSHLKFTVLGLPKDADGRRPDIKQLAWHDGALFVGLGQVDHAARLYQLTDLGADGGPTVVDITPASLQVAKGVFALEVTDDVIAVGSQRSDTDPPRVIALDRSLPSKVLLDAALSADETRVDAVAVDDDDRVVATTDLGLVYQAPRSHPPVGGFDDPVPVGEPVPDELHRFVEIDGDLIRGVSSQGTVWELGSGARPNVNVGSTGAPVGPAQPQSLHVTSRSVVIGANNAVHVRQLSSPTTVTSVSVTGETKALASDPSGRTYAATYPFARLWSISSNGADAEPVVTWDAAYLRPRAAVHDERLDVVHVLSRSDEVRATRLFAIDTRPGMTSDARRQGVPVTRANGSGVDGSAIALDPSDAEFVFVGDRSGGVQRMRWSDGEVRWRVGPAFGVWVRSLDVVGGRLIASYSGTQADGTVRRGVVELDRSDGRTIRRTQTQAAGIGGIADGLSIGPVTVTANRSRLATVDRGSTNAGDLLRHARNDTLGGPFVGADADCRIYAFEGRNLFRVPFDARSRLP